jgi:hypothetical protein
MLWKLAGVASVASFYWIWRHVGLVPAIIPPAITVLAAYVAQRSSR